MTDRTTIAAIRFGYGLPLPAGAPTDPAAMLAALRGPDLAAAAFPAPGLVGALPMMREAEQAQRAARNDNSKLDAYKAVRKRLDLELRAAGQANFARALDAPDQMRERLVRFWADHFTVVAKTSRVSQLPLTMVEDAIRPHLTAPFAVMLRAVVQHPAMLHYLDQSASVGPGSVQGRRKKRGLNENLARELIELHTLGVTADYSQADVRQLAELLTGLSFSINDGIVFQTKWVEPGPETVLGQTYDGPGLEPILAVLDDLAHRPETARHLAGKLAVHFVADDPDPDLVATVEAAYRATGGDLGAVYDALLSHPAAWAPPLGKARPPYDFLMAALRGLGVDAAGMVAMKPALFQRSLMAPMQLMGQRWQQPRGPDGWPEAASAWITPQGLAARINWAMAMPSRLVKPLPDPVEFARRVLGDAADERLLWAAARAETRREGVGLVLASPAFNRR